MPIENPSDIYLNERNNAEALIGNPPGWALRWGLTAMLAVFALMILVAHLVQYPDVVEARTFLTTQNPPIRLAARESSKIAILNVTNGATVKPGDILAELETPAKQVDLMLLDSILEKMMAEDASNFLEINIPSSLKLGTLQSSYADFSQRLKDLKYFLSKDVNYLKISNLRKQINEVTSLNKSLVRQESILQEEVLLAQKNMEMDSTLFAAKNLGKPEFEKSKSEWLARLRALEALRSGASQNNLRIQEMQAQILDLQQVQSDNESQKILDFKAEMQRLRGEIDIWKQTYLLIAPVGGTVELTRAWSEQQQVEAGTEVLTIVPQEQAGRIFAKAVLASNRSGKVKEKMKVNIRLDGFPYQEFGVLNGEVQRIAAVPGENGLELVISVPEDLKTSYGTTIPFRQEIQGTARIITEKRSLFVRILDKIISAFYEN